MHVADWIRYSRPATSETATLGIQHTELYLLVGLNCLGYAGNPDRAGLESILSILLASS